MLYFKNNTLPHYILANYTVQTIPPPPPAAAVTSLIAHPKHGHTYRLVSISCLQVMRKRERERERGREGGREEEQLTELRVGVGEGERERERKGACV